MSPLDILKAIPGVLDVVEKVGALLGKLKRRGKPGPDVAPLPERQPTTSARDAAREFAERKTRRPLP